MRKYIPNMFNTAKGETPFFERLQPWLETAERWLCDNFTGDYLNLLVRTDEGDEVLELARTIVVNEAFMRAVPNLDLVLTPNGFGIVSNNNVAPASRDRVARLVASLETNRDNAIEQFVGRLLHIPVWRSFNRWQWFEATLFPNIDLANLCGFTEHRWANYLGLRSRAIDVEQRLAAEFISPEQLAVFRDEVRYLGRPNSASELARSHFAIIEQLRQIVVNVLQGNPMNVTALRDIVNVMRNNEDDFEEFNHSRTKKLFEPPIFENKKKNHGYFF